MVAGSHSILIAYARNCVDYEGGIEYLCNIKKPLEVEEEFQKGLNKAICRWCKIHSEDENISLYVDGSSNTIVTAVARYRKNVHRRNLTFECFCHFSKSEDDPYQSQFHQITSSLPPSKSQGRKLSQSQLEISRTLPRHLPEFIAPVSGAPVKVLDTQYIEKQHGNSEPVTVLNDEIPNPQVEAESPQSPFQCDEQHKLLYSVAKKDKAVAFLLV